MAELTEAGVYDEMFMISAENGDGVQALIEVVAGRMPEGHALYPPEQTG